MGSGFMAGMASSLIYTPIEFAKIRTQMSKNPVKKGSLFRIFNILRNEKFSGLKKIYTGF